MKRLLIGLVLLSPALAFANTALAPWHDETMSQVTARFDSTERMVQELSRAYASKHHGGHTVRSIGMSWDRETGRVMGEFMIRDNEVLKVPLKKLSDGHYVFAERPLL